MFSNFTRTVAATAVVLFASASAMAAGKVQDIPGTISLKEGTYSGAKTENNNDNVGYIKNGCYATYEINCTEAGVYDMVFPVSRINGGVMTLTVTDKATKTVEATTVWEIPMSDNRDYIDRTVRIADRISTGEKTLKLLFNSDQSSWVCNYKAMTFTKYAENSASISGLKVNGETAEGAAAYDWAVNIPAAYEGSTVTLVPDAKNAIVTATAKDGDGNDVAVSKAPDGVFSIPVPSPGTEAIVTFAVEPDGANILPVKESYTLRIFRIGEDKVTELTIDGTPLTAEQLETLNKTGKFDLADWIFTAYPTVKATMVDNTVPEIAKNEKETGASYTFKGTGGKEYAINITSGFHFYTPESSDLTVTLRYSDAGITADGWSNGLYSLSGVDSGWGGTQFKYRTKTDYTLTIPSDVVVKQFIFGQLGDNYENGSVAKVTSEGATAVYLPTSSVFYPGDKTRYDLKVNIEGHKAGTPIVFNFAAGGQPVAWIDLVYEKQTLTTPPALVNTESTSTEHTNHAVVTLTFDREMADMEATIAGKTVKAKGGKASVRFAVWDLAYDSKNTLTIAAGAAKDNYGNSNAEAITIPVNVGPELPVAAIEAERLHVVASVDEWKEALKAVNASNAKADAPRAVIFVRNGSYDFGPEEQTFTCFNVSVIGESREGVILHGNRSGISNPIISTRKATNTYFQDLTIRNDLDFGTGKRDGVGAAFYGGTKDVMKNVALQSYQDTQVTGVSGYYENCDIHGVVDYICGSGDQYFYNCNLINEMSGTITAPSTDPSSTGYVFESCTIKGEGNYNLGRPWQNNPAAYFLNTKMESLASAKGWESMGNLPTRFYEFNSVDAEGKPVDLSTRKNSPTSTNTYNPVLTAEEAAEFTLHNVLGSTDSWLPTEGIADCEAPANVALADGSLSWDKVAGGSYYVVLADGEYLAAVTDSKFEIPAAKVADPAYTVRAANAMGGLGKTSEAVGGVSTGISDIEIDSANGEAEYFNLQGIRVDNPTNGIFIRRQGSKVEKVVIR